jgi:lipopolysaccharide transport system permease protein
MQNVDVMTAFDTKAPDPVSGAQHDAGAAPADPVAIEAGAVARPKPFMVIEPTSGWAALNLLEVWQYRDLLFTLASRDVKLRYKQTALGIIWVILQPLMAAGIFSFVFGKVLKAPSDGVPYFMFSFAGLLGYTAFSSTLTKASACVVGNSQLVSKVFFPRLILPLSTILSTLLDFGVSMMLMVAMMAITGIWPGWHILLLPLWLMLLVMLAVGVGLFTSALMVSYRDLQYVLPVMLQFLLYASPVAYPVSAVPGKLQMWFYVNPISGLLEAFRWSVVGRGTINWLAVGYAVLAVVAIFVLGAFEFKKMERKFADVI